jgi:hypothetical protein
MVGKHLLAMRGKASVIQNRAEEEKQRQGNAHGSRSGRQLSLHSHKQDRKQRDRGEDGKVHDPKKVKIGWHDAPKFSFDACLGACGIVKPLRLLRLDQPGLPLQVTPAMIPLTC